MTMFLKVGTGVLGLAAICASVFVFQKASAPSQTASAEKSVPSHVDTTGVAGMVMQIDPATGKVREGEALSTSNLPLSPQEQNAASTSSAGLVEVPAPGGGTMIDLQGRFQAPLVATIGPDGKMTMKHMEK